jgi:opacity protein-like surface antigen
VGGCLAVCTVLECLLGFLLLVALTAGLGSPASAGPYVAARGGLGWYPDADGFVSLPAVGGFIAARVNASFDTGYNIGGVIGWKLSWFRIELEGAYRSNDFETVSDGVIALSAQGRMHSGSVVVNALADLDFGLPVVPYVGVGLGYSRVGVSDLAVTGVSIPVSANGDEVAYQVMGGLGFPIPRVPLTLSAGYRYFSTGVAEMRWTDLPVSFPVELKYRLHEFVADLRWEF